MNGLINISARKPGSRFQYFEGTRRFKTLVSARQWYADFFGIDLSDIRAEFA